MGGYTIDDGENIYKIDYNVPNVKKKILRRHRRVMTHIKRTWSEIRTMMKFYISYGIGTNDLMKKYVRLFINQSRIKL
jgi:hypothetical protein